MCAHTQQFPWRYIFFAYGNQWVSPLSAEVIDGVRCDPSMVHYCESIELHPSLSAVQRKLIVSVVSQLTTDKKLIHLISVSLKLNWFILLEIWAHMLVYVYDWYTFNGHAIKTEARVTEAVINGAQTGRKKASRILSRSLFDVWIIWW